MNQSYAVTVMQVMSRRNETSDEVVTTPVFTLERLDSLRTLFWIYQIQGFALSCSNFVILGAIVKQKLLRWRKAYIVVAALAFADGMNGVATLWAGITRQWQLWLGTAVVLSSRWSCLLRPWNLIWVWADPLMNVMLLVISVDRLLAVSVPIRYFCFTWRYAVGLIAVPCAWIALSTIVCFVLTWEHRTAEYPEICFTDWSMDDRYHAYWQTLMPIVLCLSVVLYAVVPIVYRMRRPHRKVTPTGEERRDPQTQQQLRQQRRLTVSLGISSFFTLALGVAPMFYEAWEMSENNTIDHWSTIIPYILTANNLNSFTNFFIYIIRHRDIRVSVRYLFNGKQLTEQHLRELR